MLRRVTTNHYAPCGQTFKIKKEFDQHPINLNHEQIVRIQARLILKCCGLKFSSREAINAHFE